MLKRTLIVATTFSLVVSVSAGCTSDITITPVGEGGSAAGGIPLSEVGGLWAAALCTAYENCLGDVYGLFVGGEDCVTNTTAQFDDQELHLQQLIDAGTVSYDGTQVQACVDALEASSCAELASGDHPECELVVTGTVDIGGDCDADAECTGDAFCAHDNSCPGRCEAEAVAGASCTRDGACQDGLACDEQTCVEPGGDGAACGGGVEPDCTLGLFCLGGDEDSSTPGSCVTMADAFAATDGMPCSTDTVLCEPDLSCTVDTIGMGGATFVCAPGVGSGADCTVGFPDPCPADEYCDAPNLMMGDATGSCTPLAVAGEPCTQPAFGDPACARYSRCDNGTCRPRASVGGSCSEDNVCYSTNCVSGSCQLESSCE